MRGRRRVAILKLILVVIVLVGAVAAIAWLYRDTVLVRLFGPVPSKNLIRRS